MFKLLKKTRNRFVEVFENWSKDFNNTDSDRFTSRRAFGSFETLEAREVFSASLPTFDTDSGILYQIHGVNDAQGQLSEIDLINDSFSDVGEKSGFKINGIGFRVDDGYIYGVKMDTDELIRLGSNGQHEVLGKVSGLPNGNFFTGDFGEDGLLYLRHQNVYYGVDVDTRSVEREVVASENVTRTYDIAYSPATKLHYSIRKAENRAEFISIDLSSDSNAATIEVINDDLKPVGTFGALFADAGGRVFAASNAGGLYEIDIDTGVATFAGQSPRASSNDGAASPNAFFDLPPVATDAWMSTIAGSESSQMPIDAPYDLEGQALQVKIIEFPEVGLVTTASGAALRINQVLSVKELTELHYAPPAEASDVDKVKFVYEVSDGSQTVSAQVDIHLAGLSKLSGNVVVIDDTEESSFEGYIYNNEIWLTGMDFLGNAVKRSITTDVNGFFEFNELLPGEYQVEQVQPPVVFDGFVDKGFAEGVISKNRVSEIMVGSASSAIEGLTFYEMAPTLLAGFVYVDKNSNEVIDVEEIGIANASIVLSGTDYKGNSIKQSAATDSYGYYEFRGLPPGVYSVTQVQPGGFVSGVSNVGDFGGHASEDRISKISLMPGEVGNGYHFAEYEKSTLSGVVFIDNDADNAFDLGDTVLADVTVTLVGTDLRGNDVKIETTTDDLGQYSFTDLLAGTYDLIQGQPDGVKNGRSHVGIFNNDETVLDSNGVADVDRINEIEIGFGRFGRSFNFSELLDYKFSTKLTQEIVFEGTEGKDRFEFVAGTNEHIVKVNGKAYEIDATVPTNIVFDAKGGEDRISITGSNQVERVVVRNFGAVMRSENWRVAAENSEQIFVDSGGGFDRAFMYDTVDDDRLKMTQDYTRIWNDDVRFETRGFHRTYAYSENGGFDRAYLYDSKYDDTVKMTDENARVISRKYYSIANNFDRVYAYAVNGGNDRAQFWDSELSNDVFQGRSDFSRMYNSSFFNLARGFGQVDAFGRGGGENDRAYLYGTEKDEILVASPTKAGLVGDGFKFDVHQFERTYAESQGGNDRAYLFDSKLDDRFIAGPDDAKLYNDDYYLLAKAFSQVDAYSSSGGNDRAYFYDSEGDDTLITLENEVRMFGNGFDNTSHGFARAYAHSDAGGNDQGFLYDTDQADTVKIGENVSKMYGDTYYTLLSGFEKVTTKFANSSRHDRALVFGAVDEDTLALTGGLAKLIEDHASEFIYDIDLHDDFEDDDSDLDSIFDDLEELLVMKK